MRPAEEIQDLPQEVVRAEGRDARILGQARVLRLGEEVQQRAAAETQHPAQDVLQHQQAQRHQVQARHRPVHQG